MSFILASSTTLDMYWNAFWLSTEKRKTSIIINSGRHDRPLFLTAETCLQSSCIPTATQEVLPASQYSTETKMLDLLLPLHIVLIMNANRNNTNRKNYIKTEQSIYSKRQHTFAPGSLLCSPQSSPTYINLSSSLWKLQKVRSWCQLFANRDHIAKSAYTYLILLYIKSRLI